MHARHVFPSLVVTAVCAATAAGVSAQRGPVSEAPFAPGGRIELYLDGGAYEVRPGGDRIRVIPQDDLDGTRIDIRIDGRRAEVRIDDTPSSFDAVIEVPEAEYLVVELDGGLLDLDAVASHTDVESVAGEITIAVGDPSRYARVDASVLAGNLETGPFGQDRSGLFRTFEWRGGGTDTLDVSLGAGNLELKRR
jgi:hypothetical protein